MNAMILAEIFLMLAGALIGLGLALGGVAAIAYMTGVLDE